MPTYEYECSECGHNFEEFQSITAPPISLCPHCSGRKVRRLIGSGSGVIFKGSGFYQTDYRSDSYKQSVKSEKEQAGSGKSSDSAGKSSRSDKKPDKKNNKKNT